MWVTGTIRGVTGVISCFRDRYVRCDRSDYVAVDLLARGGWTLARIDKVRSHCSKSSVAGLSLTSVLASSGSQCMCL